MRLDGKELLKEKIGKLTVNNKKIFFQLLN